MKVKEEHAAKVADFEKERAAKEADFQKEHVDAIKRKCPIALYSECFGF